MINEEAFQAKPAAGSGKGVYFTGMGICMVLLYVFNNLLSLYFLYIPEGSNFVKAIMDNSYTKVEVPFLGLNFINCLWAINLALGLGLMGNFALLLYRPRWFHFLFQAVLISVGILPVYVVRKHFPFIIESQSIHALINTGLNVFMVILIAASLFMFFKGAVIFVRTIRNFERL